MQNATSDVKVETKDISSLQRTIELEKAKRFGARFEAAEFFATDLRSGTQDARAPGDRGAVPAPDAA